jgi:hypothetical protein
MNRILQNELLVAGYVNRIPQGNRIVWGLGGGLAGTMTMDILLMPILKVFKLSALLCFSIVGETVTRFLGIHIDNVLWVGVAAHYIIGPLVGVLFVVLATRLPALRVVTLKQLIIAAVLFVELFSQPILVLAPILISMTGRVITLWYAGSFVMHFILAVVMGSIMYYGFHRSIIK